MSERCKKPWMDYGIAMDKLVNCAAKIIKGSGATPGFCSQDIEDRLQTHHAAMDFTGAGGRIVTDPREAAEIAHMESRLRPTPRMTWSSSSASCVEDTCPAPGQPWFKPGVTRDQANNALLPLRAGDGIFVIRECSRGQGGFVLSFTTQGKVVHAQIIRLIHEGKTAYSLDGGKTKFPNLEQLVDFHKMNTGPLPTLLKEKHVPVCPTASLIKLS